MKIEIYADGANEKDILFYNKQKSIKGLTTNPSLMKKSGIKNYKNFAKKILKKVAIKFQLLVYLTCIWMIKRQELYYKN